MKKRQYYVLLALLVFGLPRGLYATTIVQVDMEQLLQDAAVIFEGEVVASEAQWNAQNTSITTLVTFAVTDVIKGDLPAPTITLSFGGGTVGDITLKVSGIVYPQVGENGIYFIENPARQQVNPLLGWSQGHFKVKQDGHGEERVFTESGEPVQDVADAAASTRSAEAARDGAVLPLSEGAALGLRVGTSSDGATSAMAKEAFKNTLRDRLAGQKTATPRTGQAAQ